MTILKEAALAALQVAGIVVPRPPRAVPDAATARILDLAREGVLICALDEPDMPLTYVSPSFEQMTGYSRAEAIGRNCRFLQGVDRDQPEIAVIRDAIARRTDAAVTLRNYRKDGRMFWNELQMQPLPGPDGRATHYIGLMRDVTALRESSGRLAFAAATDRLTGCLNRYALTDRLSQLAVDPACRTMLVKVDVLGFSAINSGYGHDAGDAVLSQVAGRLRQLDIESVGRIGSNEFAVAFRLGAGEDGAPKLAALQALIAPRYTLPGGIGAPIDLRFAIGFVIGGPGDDGTTLVRRAGTALAQSKATSGGGPREFDASAAVRAEQRLRMASEIQQGVARDEFLYHYQPKVDLQTGAIVGAEALLRWRHPTKGLLLPGDFLDLAEETGLIVDIGLKGFRDVATFTAALNRGLASPINVAINVSTTMARQPDIVARAARVLADVGLDPAQMTVELTEGLMAESSAELVEIFHDLRKLGLGLSIDDFGTGYSNLRYLESFALTEIKIDRSFVHGMIAQPTKRFIVDAVLKIGWALNLTVVAEGVETEDEAVLLRELGCPMAQGYLFGRPMPPEAFLALIAEADGDRRREAGAKVA